MNKEVIIDIENPKDNDAISREDALMALTGEWTEITDEIIHRFIRRIKALPSVNPQEKTGYWIDADGDNAICSCCNRLNHLYGTYCKHCGTKMDKAESEINNG